MYIGLEIYNFLVIPLISSLPNATMAEGSDLNLTNYLEEVEIKCLCQTGMNISNVKSRGY